MLFVFNHSSKYVFDKCLKLLCERAFVEIEHRCRDLPLTTLGLLYCLEELWSIELEAFNLLLQVQDIFIDDLQSFGRLLAILNLNLH